MSLNLNTSEIQAIKEQFRQDVESKKLALKNVSNRASLRLSNEEKKQSTRPKKR